MAAAGSVAHFESAEERWTAPVVAWATGWRCQQKFETRSDSDGRLYTIEVGKPVRERAAFGLVIFDGMLVAPEDETGFAGYEIAQVEPK